MYTLPFVVAKREYLCCFVCVIFRFFVVVVVVVVLVVVWLLFFSSSAKQDFVEATSLVSASPCSSLLDLFVVRG